MRVASMYAASSGREYIRPPEGDPFCQQRRCQMADTSTAPEIGEAETALKSIADSVKAANDLIKGISDPFQT